MVDESKCLDIPIFGICNNVDASSILTWVFADTASAACPAHPGSLEIISICDCHLWCWWSSFSEHYMRTRIIFYNVTSEYDPAVVFLISRFQLRILKMTKIHQWRDMNFSSLISCFIDHLFLALTFVSCYARIFSSFSFPFTLLPLHLDFPLLEASEWTCEQDCNDFENSSLCQWYDIGDVCVQLLPALVSCFRRHQHHKHILSCVSQYLGGSPLLFIGILQGIAAGIGTSNFLRAALMLSLNSSSFGSIENIPLNCLALSSFGFSMPIFVLLSSFAASAYAFTYLAIHCPGEGCLFSCISSQTMCTHQVTFRSPRWILWSLSLHLTILFLHPRSSGLQYVSPSIHPRMYESFW